MIGELIGAVGVFLAMYVFIEIIRGVRELDRCSRSGSR